MPAELGALTRIVLRHPTRLPSESSKHALRASTKEKKKAKEKKAKAKPTKKHAGNQSEVNGGGTRYWNLKTEVSQNKNQRE